MSVGRSVDHFGPDWNNSTTVWIDMKLYTEIHGPHEMDCTYSDDHLTLHIGMVIDKNLLIPIP